MKSPEPTTRLFERLHAKETLTHRFVRTKCIFRSRFYPIGLKKSNLRKRSWPSGLRRSTQVRISKEAGVRNPLNASLNFCTFQSFLSRGLEYFRWRFLLRWLTCWLGPFSLMRCSAPYLKTKFHDCSIYGIRTIAIPDIPEFFPCVIKSSFFIYFILFFKNLLPKAIKSEKLII